MSGSLGEERSSSRRKKGVSRGTQLATYKRALTRRVLKERRAQLEEEKKKERNKDYNPENLLKQDLLDQMKQYLYNLIQIQKKGVVCI